MRIGEETRTLTLAERAGSLLWQGEQIPFELGSEQIRLCQGGHWQRYPVQPLGEDAYLLHLAGRRIRFSLDDQHHQLHHDHDTSHVPGILAPMHGIVVALQVEAGQPVSKGQPLLVLEAMKMEHVLKADRDGVIEALQCRQGEQVSQGAVLVRFAEDHTAQEERS